MEEMISLFIDDEMGLDEKIGFVQEVRSSPSFASEALELLRMEKQIRADVVQRLPSALPAGPGILKRITDFFSRPLGWTAGALTAAVIALVWMALPATGPVLKENRFVVYQPQANRVEIAGSFTGWKRIPLHKDGDSGYWELTLALPQGEYAYSYIAEGGRQFADPTARARVPDDFGGFNSILKVGNQV